MAGAGATFHPSRARAGARAPACASAGATFDPSRAIFKKI